MKNAKIELGDTVKDIVTGYQGVVVALTYWLNGCCRVSVAPEKLDKEGKVKDSHVFDVEQLVLVKKGTHRLPESPLLPERRPTGTGGDRPSVPRGHEVRR